MSMTDPIADMFTRIRNGQSSEKSSIVVQFSRIKKEILDVLKDEGYILGYEEKAEEGKPVLEVALKYYAGRPVIDVIKRISKPGQRKYKGSENLGQINGGLGISIISTSKGIMTDRVARKMGIGGEILGVVS